MKRFRIALLGRLAPSYAPAFSDHDCRIIDEPEAISTEDDLVFCVAFPKRVPSQVLARPRHGVFVNHSSDLPKGRGWAPLQWSVITGLTEITTTIFKAEPEYDTGPWAFKQSFPVAPLDTIADLYTKDLSNSVALFRRLIEAINDGSLVLHPQQGEPTYWKRRTPVDSQLDPKKPLSVLWNQIRVCDNAMYPAYFVIDGCKVYLRYEIASG